MDDDLIRNEQTLFDDLETVAGAVAPEQETATPKLRDEDEIPSARETQSSGQPDALVSYIRSISATPILSREQQYELAGALETHREAFLDAIFSVPATAVVIVQRWRERKAAGYVTATFSAITWLGRKTTLFVPKSAPSNPTVAASRARTPNFGVVSSA